MVSVNDCRHLHHVLDAVVQFIEDDNCVSADMTFIL